jgi:hypothetical protein
MYAAGVRKLVQREPWRAGQGRAKNALDPSYFSTPMVQCEGPVEWEKDEKWWWCRSCGYCGCYSRLTHFAPELPDTYYTKSLDFFYRQRASQGLTVQQAKEQALHLMGIALRMAAAMSPEDLCRYIEKQVMGELQQPE